MFNVLPEVVNLMDSHVCCLAEVNKIWNHIIGRVAVETGIASLHHVFDANWVEAPLVAQHRRHSFWCLLRSQTLLLLTPISIHAPTMDKFVCSQL